LVIQVEPPKTTEEYVHRSGRTGRAGKKGVCVTFYSIKDSFKIKKIEHDARIKIEDISPPNSVNNSASRSRSVRNDTSLTVTKSEL